MEKPKNNKLSKKSPKSTISFALAIAAVIIIAASYPISLLIEDLGIVDFLSLATIFAIAAIILSVISRISTNGETNRDRRSTAALAIGIAAIVIIVLIRVAIFIAFIPMLGQ